MSVRNETYLIYGVKLDVKKSFKSHEDDYEKWESMDFPYLGEGATGKLGVLVDGMGGNYSIAGKILGVKNEEGSEDFGLIDLSTIDFSPISELAKEVDHWVKANQLEELFGEESKAYSLFLVSHYH